MSRLKTVTDPTQKMEEKGRTGSVVDLMKQVFLRSLGVPPLLSFPKSPTEKQSRAWWQRRKKDCGGVRLQGVISICLPRGVLRFWGSVGEQLL